MLTKRTKSKTVKNRAGLFKKMDGYSLIEMIIVVAIIAIIAGMSGVMVGRDALHMAKIKKGIIGLHALKKGLESLDGMCGGPVYSTLNPISNQATAFRDLMCNNYSNIRVWPNFGCGSGNNSNLTQLPGLQNFIDEIIYPGVGAGTPCSTQPANPPASSELSDLDQIFNGEEMNPGCTSGGCGSIPQISQCPLHPSTGYTIAVEPFNTAFTDPKKVLGPNTVICGVVAPRNNWQVMVLMNKDGLGQVNISGTPLTSACATGPYCSEFKDGASNSGCCSDMGYRW